MLIPVLHRVLIKPQDVRESDEVIRRATSLGIHVELDRREEKAVEIGTVLSVGETAFTGAFETSVRPQVGDKIYFAKYAGKEVNDPDGSKYIILNDEDIVAIVKE